jgi:hypothetical protein
MRQERRWERVTKMPRIYRKGKSKRPEVQDHIWEWLCDENPTGVDEDGNFSFEIFQLEGDDDGLRKLWEDVEDDVLDYHIANHPGTRPACWWKFSAPRIPVGTWDVTAGTFLDGKLPEPRLQVSGAGDPPWERFNYAPEFEFGIPKQWVGLDPKDPPRFESQAHYLRRHGLFLPGEEKKLTAADFEHQQVDIPNSEVLTELAENQGSA